MLEGHADWVRDVAWAPNIGLPRSYIATASQVSSSPSVSVPSGACVGTLFADAASRWMGRTRPC